MKTGTPFSYKVLRLQSKPTSAHACSDRGIAHEHAIKRDYLDMKGIRNICNR